MTKHMTVSQPAFDALLHKLAREHLGIETLDVRHMDRLDFFDVSVWSVRSALTAAYNAGMNAACSQPHSKS
jgi:Family of unknown function (DUF6900)